MIVEEIVKVRRSLKEEGGPPILLAEQNLRTTLSVADSRHVLSKGEICFTGTSRLKATGSCYSTFSLCLGYPRAGLRQRPARDREI
jgi:ABC-type branched-subunit amino acid transport system ATPase component